jgi:hypothetical protein
VYGIGMDTNEMKNEDKLLDYSVDTVIANPLLHKAMLTMKLAIKEQNITAAA